MHEHLEGARPHFESEHRIRHADGHWLWALSRGLATRDGDGRAVRITGSISDVTERRMAQDRLAHSALHDGLTGLPNRALFMDRLSHRLAHLETEPAASFALLCLDLDRFKLVNDSLSRAAGDQLLLEVGRRVSAMLRPGDTLARLGGDEFAALVEGVTSERQAVELAEQLGEVLAPHYRVAGRDLKLTTSIGVLYVTSGSATPDELVRNAGIAMYEGKRAGGGRCRLFDPAMRERVLSRVTLETRLRRVIDQDRLEAVFQPIVRLRDGRLHGFEALARWPFDEQPVPPSEFVPVAEEAGLIDDLGHQVMRAACDALVAWDRQGLLDPSTVVNVNVSAQQIVNGRLVEDVRSLLAERGLAPQRLVLEITESTLVRNAKVVDEVLFDLMALGVSLQLDDFGTGYSSLTALHDFPGNVLKIDRSFVDTMLTRSRSRTIIRSIIGLAHSLGLGVTSEGIEEPDQLAALTQLSCEYGQGYLFARPMSAAAVARFVPAAGPDLRASAVPGAGVGD